MKWKIKRETNDDLRQKFIDQTAPQIEFLGLSHPDKNLKWNEKRSHYDCGEINWDEFWRVINGDGHCNRQRVQHHINAHEEGAWVREALVSYQQKKKTKAA
jgi:ring-1,2-phenylacetyl-CoA epoxidase subunit PaaA